MTGCCTVLGVYINTMTTFQNIKSNIKGSNSFKRGGVVNCIDKHAEHRKNLLVHLFLNQKCSRTREIFLLLPEHPVPPSAASSSPPPKHLLVDPPVLLNVH